ncbi:hypothetical protein U27_06779 [Candidatus Vecturithrix granuli]|uniref:Outer membrane protein beta-barrel domain-containing protein n=1 Tax=Vecturithrix granuli TaxID=1499967 RepID=A0A081C5D9_VECG1|nr:hypothetical protein U27_06779 [Candidatus Vecturithrix granuli]
MTTRSHKGLWICIFVGCLLIWWASDSSAANISEFVNITPYLEIEGVYDDNVFELSEDASLPEDAEEHEDFLFNTRAGVGVDLNLERPYLKFGIGVDYDFTYSKYTNNTEQDGVEHNLDFELDFLSKYEKGIVRDRVKFNIRDVLSLIPIDEEEPLLPGNRALRNEFEVGLDYKLISTRRISFTVGYAYGRTDYENTSIEVETVADQYEHSDDLTQESQIHSGKADFQYVLNSKLTYVLSYVYQFSDREENLGELVSANFSRHNVLSGIQAKLTPRIHSNFRAGYTLTSYDDVGNLSQSDQDNFVVEASVTANFARQPLMTVGYRRYYTENDFGDTLLTDNVFGRMGIKVTKELLVNLSADYILEDRDLYDDDTKQMLFGVNTEYEILKNMMLLVGYNYRNKEFFEQNFLAEQEREETTHTFSGGLQYQVARYVLLKGMYYYTDKSSDIAEQEYSRNQFIASGRVIF